MLRRERILLLVTIPAQLDPGENSDRRATAAESQKTMGMNTRYFQSDQAIQAKIRGKGSEELASKQGGLTQIYPADDAMIMFCELRSVRERRPTETHCAGKQ